MKLKNFVVITMLLLVSIIFLPQIVRAFGPATILKGIELLGELIPGNDSLKNGLEDFKISREIDEQHAFGDNIVFVHKADKKDKHGHIFVAYNKEKKIIMGWLFCSDEKDTYPKFQKMNLLEKKLFLLENFLQYAEVDLGPIYTPRPGDSAENVLAELGKPDDSIPLYYEDEKIVSEMLIYYESPKKFLAVDIARGKVARTQELEIKEGQGLKDALASAGITPAAMKSDNSK